jgi:hypothetical protein
MQMPSDQDIQSRFEELPEDVRQAVQSADMASALQAVGATHGLHVDQLGSLEDEALLVMLGFANPAQFPDAIKNALKIDDAAARDIAREVSERLFVPIRNSMRAYMDARLKKQSGRAQSPTDSVPPAVRGIPVAKIAVTVAAVPTLASSSAIKPVTSNQQLVTSPAPGGGKTIMPSGIMPTIHPFDHVLSSPIITTPTTTVISAPLSDAPKASTMDPYREPVE